MLQFKKGFATRVNIYSTLSVIGCTGFSLYYHSMFFGFIAFCATAIALLSNADR